MSRNYCIVFIGWIATMGLVRIFAINKGAKVGMENNDVNMLGIALDKPVDEIVL